MYVNVYSGGMELITELHTERLALRKMKEADASGLFRIWSDPDVTRFMNVSNFTHEDQARDMIRLLDGLSRNKQAIRYSIILKDTGDLIGSCGFNAFDDEQGMTEIGYDLAKAAWGKGYATEAIGALLEYAFMSLGMRRVEAKVESENAGSVKLLHKLGFAFEGTVEEGGSEGEPVSALHLYARTKA